MIMNSPANKYVFPSKYFPLSSSKTKVRVPEWQELSTMIRYLDKTRGGRLRGQYGPMLTLSHSEEWEVRVIKDHHFLETKKVKCAHVHSHIPVMWQLSRIYTLTLYYGVIEESCLGSQNSLPKFRDKMSSSHFWLVLTKKIPHTGDKASLDRCG